MKIYKYFSFRLTPYLLAVLAVLSLGCAGNTVEAEDMIQIEPWDVEYEWATIEPFDYYDKPGESVNRILPYYGLFKSLKDAKYANALTLTEETRTNVEKQLSTVLAPSFLSDDLLDMVKLYSTNLTFMTAWRQGEVTSSNDYWFTLAFKVADARILAAGVPGDGLIEVIVFTDYADLDQFNSLAHYYFNLPETSKAEIDYRPTDWVERQVGVPHPLNWDHQGYIIRINDQGRTGWIRSSSRAYSRYDTETAVPEDLETQAIELSLRCEPAFQPDE